MNKISIGTAQFGMEYGISNVNGQTTYKEMKYILNSAYENNIYSVDLSDSYGDSLFKIKKYNKMNKKEEWLFNFKIKNLKNLKLQFKKIENKILYKPDCLMLHNFKNFKNISHLNDIYYNNDFKIGYSLYNIEELDLLIENDIKFDRIQIPFNLFDKRFNDNEKLVFLKKNKIEIHARSVFLQGLFFLSNTNIAAHFPDLNKLIYEISENLSFKKFKLYELSLIWVLSHKYIDKAVIGFESHNQFMDIINFVNNITYNQELIKQLEGIRVDDLNILLPYNWN